MQRDIAEKNNIIMDGRDIGTVVLPNAEVKIFSRPQPSAGQEGVSSTLRKGRKVDFAEV